MKHLWEVEHSYYCNLGNYYSNGCGHTYESFHDFNSEWGSMDMDYNLLFRWDWKVEDPADLEEGEAPRDHDVLEVFWMLQRKGAYRFCEVKVTKKDEQAVIDFILPRWEYMKSLWEPFGFASSDAIKTTEQPSKAAAVEGILTEEELKERNRLLVLENDEQTTQIERLKWICKRSSDFIDAMVSFTGQNLSVLNWHQNGDGEPFDNFVEENLEENLITDLKTALEELK